MSMVSTVWNYLFVAQPSALFRKHYNFYFVYDQVWLWTLLAGHYAISATGWQGFGVTFGWHLIPLFALFMYFQILGSVFIHNCVHGNWPFGLNRIVGELVGAFIITRYASWEILHRRHHEFPDDNEKDPHYVVPSFWKFLFFVMIGNLEPNLWQQYLELWGNTPANVKREKIRSTISFLMIPFLLFTFYRFLGFWLWAVYAPTAGLGLVHISHFNWITHGGDRLGKKTTEITFREGQEELNDGVIPEAGEPVNLDHGIYWLGNRVAFGLYYHKNHHEYTKKFNPMNVPKKARFKVSPKME